MPSDLRSCVVAGIDGLLQYVRTSSELAVSVRSREGDTSGVGGTDRDRRPAATTFECSELPVQPNTAGSRPPPQRPCSTSTLRCRCPFSHPLRVQVLLPCSVRPSREVEEARKVGRGRRARRRGRSGKVQDGEGAGRLDWRSLYSIILRPFAVVSVARTGGEDGWRCVREVTWSGVGSTGAYLPAAPEERTGRTGRKS